MIASATIRSRNMNTKMKLNFINFIGALNLKLRKTEIKKSVIKLNSKELPENLSISRAFVIGSINSLENLFHK